MGHGKFILKLGHLLLRIFCNCESVFSPFSITEKSKFQHPRIFRYLYLSHPNRHMVPL